MTLSCYDTAASAAGRRVRLMFQFFPPIGTRDDAKDEVVRVLMRFDDHTELNKTFTLPHPRRAALFMDPIYLITASMSDQVAVKVGGNGHMLFDLRPARAKLRTLHWLCADLWREPNQQKEG